MTDPTGSASSRRPLPSPPAAGALRLPAAQGRSGDGDGSALPLDPAVAFDALGRIVLANNSVSSVMNTVASLAKSTIPGAYEVSVTLLDGDRASTVASTGQAALDLDERQYAQGFGPCMEAARTESVVEIPDMAGDDRYAEFGRLAVGMGVHSSLTMPIPMQQHLSAALNIYSDRTGAFDEDSRQLASTFASYAGVAMANMHLFERTSQLAEQLETAMSSRAVIEQAKGILMGARRCTAEEAFQTLVAQSQQRNRKLRDVAQELVDRAGRPAR